MAIVLIVRHHLDEKSVINSALQLFGVTCVKLKLLRMRAAIILLVPFVGTNFAIFAKKHIQRAFVGELFVINHILVQSYMV
jgi:hypothetical protein